MTQSILVTGGAGFIGSHVCKALAQAGYRPVTFDDLSHGHREAVKWGPLEIGGLGNREQVETLIKAWRPSAVIHLAGYIAVGESVADPAKYYRNNVSSMLTFLDALRDNDLNRVVFSSSAAVYGASATQPIKEDAPLLPTAPYGQTKLMAEHILRDYTVYGMSSVSLRYFNAAGADPDGETGEMHDPETHLIPLLLDVAGGLRPHIDVFGDRHPTPDGTCIRDYVHVSDLARAHVLALESIGGEPDARAYNLGNGRGYSVSEVISTVEKVTKKRIPKRIKGARFGDPPTLVADPALAKEELGWRQEHARLATQVRHAWNWHQRMNVGRSVTERLAAT